MRLIFSFLVCHLEILKVNNWISQCPLRPIRTTGLTSIASPQVALKNTMETHHIRTEDGEANLLFGSANLSPFHGCFDYSQGLFHDNVLSLTSVLECGKIRHQYLPVHVTAVSLIITNNYIGQLGLWHFSASVNSSFKRACAAIQ